jgi:DNA-binding transcriptional ArsR family regulator
MVEKYTRQPLFRIEDIETLKVITDPLRLQILELLSLEPRTVKYVADSLGLSSSRLYYHFNLMESKGLISVVDTRTVNNIIEKYYWNTADDYEINNEILTFSSEVDSEDLTRLVGATLEATRDDFMRSLHAKRSGLGKSEEEESKEAIVYRVKKRVKEEAYQAYMQKMKALLEEFQSLPEEEVTEPDATVLTIAMFLYPSIYYEDERPNEQA